jgi:hypothetical protein
VFPFTAREVEIGNDRYGDPQTSRVIDWNVKRDEPKPEQEKDEPEPKPEQKEEKPPSAQAILEEAMTDSAEIKTATDAGGTDTVRAVRKEIVRSRFKTAYLAEHPNASATAVRQAWQRALKQAKAAATMTEGTVDGAPYLWRPTSAS